MLRRRRKAAPLFGVLTSICECRASRPLDTVLRSTLVLKKKRKSASDGGSTPLTQSQVGRDAQPANARWEHWWTAAAWYHIAAAGRLLEGVGNDATCDQLGS